MDLTTLAATITALGVVFGAIFAVCTLCRDHERSGFIHGVQVGIRLAQELAE